MSSKGMDLRFRRANGQYFWSRYLEGFHKFFQLSSVPLTSLGTEDNKHSENVIQLPKWHRLAIISDQ